jgi:DNA-binding MarR family transcriptional regulator
VTRREDLLRRAHRLRAISVDFEVARTRFAQANGLRGTDVRALIALLDAERAGVPATPGWLAEQLGLSSASTTALVDRLTTAGLVRREADAADRRRIRILVTEQAVALGWSFFGPLLDEMVEALRRFDAEELEVVDRFLELMADAVGARRTRGGPGAADEPPWPG